VAASLRAELDALEIAIWGRLPQDNQRAPGLGNYHADGVSAVGPRRT